MWPSDLLILTWCKRLHHIKYEYVGSPFKKPSDKVRMGNDTCAAWEQCVWGRPGGLWCQSQVSMSGQALCWVYSVSRNEGFGLEDCKSDIFANPKSASMVKAKWMKFVTYHRIKYTLDLWAQPAEMVWLCNRRCRAMQTWSNHLFSSRL